jgi:hypothetical protein
MAMTMTISRRAFVAGAALVAFDARSAAAARPSITVYKDPG